MIRKLLVLFFIVASTHSFAQYDSSAIDQQINSLRLQRMQIEAESERLRRQTEQMENARQLEELRQDIYRREVEAKERAEEEAARSREVAQFEAARSTNTTLLLIFFAALAWLVVSIAKKSKDPKNMKYEQKYGIAFMVSSFFVSMLLIAASDNWVPGYDLIQNLMLSMRIKFSIDLDLFDSPFRVDVATKSLLAITGALFAYGFTTYLEITPAWKSRAKKSSDSSTP